MICEAQREANRHCERLQASRTPQKSDVKKRRQVESSYFRATEDLGSLAIELAIRIGMIPQDSSAFRRRKQKESPT
jgi:hypothetical protein